MAAGSVRLRKSSRDGGSLSGVKGRMYVHTYSVCNLDPAMAHESTGMHSQSRTFALKQLTVAFLGGPKEMPKPSVGLAFFFPPFASPSPPLCGITHLNQIWARKLARANHAYSLPITPYSVT